MNDAMNTILLSPPYNAWDPAYRQRLREAVFENLMNHNLGFTGLNGNAEKRDALRMQNGLANAVIPDLQGAANESFSDIYGGVTDNRIVGTYGHHIDDNDGSTYWLYPDNIVERYTNSESFAHYYGRNMVPEPERTAGLDSIHNNLPRTETMLDNILEEME